jgi:hypothetical protein
MTELTLGSEPALPKRRKRKRRARGKVAKRVRLARTKNSSPHHSADGNTQR